MEKLAGSLPKVVVERLLGPPHLAQVVGRDPVRALDGWAGALAQRDHRELLGLARPVKSKPTGTPSFSFSLGAVAGALRVAPVGPSRI